MKKIILSIALVTSLTSLSVAQDVNTATTTKKQTKKDMTPDERSKASANWAEKKLGLNSQQKTDWQVAVLNRITVNKPLREKLNGSTTPEQRKEVHKQIKTNNEDFYNKVNAFLSPEQKTKFEQIKKEKQEAHKARIKTGKAKADAIEEDVDG